MRLESPKLASPGGFSLVELLCVITLIGAILAFAVPVMSNWRGAAQEAAIEQQEKQINQVYRAVKASRMDMPSTLPEILSVLSSDPQIGIAPPPTMEGPNGVMTLTFDPGQEWFSYVAAPPMSDI
ncbi:MAG: type II secretion system protein [Terrimicrobiaceae bacterium]|nr:type II secretion system protein [Terrimicrobiaceae bacterium]